MSTPQAQLEQHLLTRYMNEFPAQAARDLEARPVSELVETLQALGPEATALAVQRLNPEIAADALEQLAEPVATALLTKLDPVRAAGVLARMPKASRQRLLDTLPKRIAADLVEVLEFPVDSAGWLMDARVTTFRESDCVRYVLSSIRGLVGRRITDVVIASDDGVFAGVVPLQSLVAADPEQLLSDLVRRDAPRVTLITSRDEVVDLMNADKLASIPVVDVHGYVRGVIRYDALVTAAQQVVGQSMQQMVGAAAEERALSSPIASVKSRLPWLLINLLTAFLASAVVSLFDSTIAQFTALAVLMPVVAGQSGNTGAQALAVTARALAIKEIRISHIWRVLLKEGAAAFINGVVVAGATGASVYFWSGSIGLAGVIGISMVISMLLAALAGGAIPIILTALKRDPATASSIVLTTVTDVCGFFSFLGLATLLSSWLTAG